MKPLPQWISAEFQKCIDFHGHLCPGLAMGYRAAKAAMERLSAIRARDEEIVAIVETDACGVDAIQVITGCTFGKGNFIFKDHGKTVFTFASRITGNGVRVAAIPRERNPRDDAHMNLVGKIREGTATDDERSIFQSLHQERSRDVLERPVEELFTITFVKIEMPEKARIEASENCGTCGEPTMASKLVPTSEGRLCRECADKRP